MEATLVTIVHELFGIDIAVTTSRPEPQFGDFSTNVALQLAGRVGKPPREVAELIAAKLRETNNYADVSVAGPGFINITLADSTLLSALSAPAPSTESHTYVIEYSCPNAFKEFHTGHLYQTIIGDIIARLVETAGHTVHRTSFGGDVGLHVAKCIWGMIATLGGELPEKLASVEATPFARARWISDCYVRGAGAYEESDEAKVVINELNKTIYSLHTQPDNQSAIAQLYWTTRQWSFDYFDAFYDVLHVDHMHYIPESETMPIGMDVVREQLEKGNLKESEGAVVFEGDETKHLHTRVFVTSKGLPTYETKDIGVIWLERRDYNFEKRILITGNDQQEYMRVVFAAAELFRPELTGEMTHLTNGTVRFGDGSKMSSRLGNVTRAIDVFNVVREKVSELVSDETLVDSVTLGAIKYVFAKYRLGGDISFDIDETISLAGNSGPYIQYAHARARSIVAKSTLEPSMPEDAALDPAERNLVRKLGEYNDAVSRATNELAPHHICNYLFELAQEFNRFYELSRVIGHEREALRLWLVGRYADTLAAGLGLLGIDAPENM
ncbi:MAG TPA: arginine--tRNA ligase [Patescibacteria group bacterium]|jgi:arginyl-tRNA synthetase|nr:arginine--tRNA ligase [Patescibacteria group bacterium]